MTIRERIKTRIEDEGPLSVDDLKKTFIFDSKPVGYRIAFESQLRNLINDGDIVLTSDHKLEVPSDV